MAIVKPYIFLCLSVLNNKLLVPILGAHFCQHFRLEKGDNGGRPDGTDDVSIRSMGLSSVE